MNMVVTSGMGVYVHVHDYMTLGQRRVSVRFDSHNDTEWSALHGDPQAVLAAIDRARSLLVAAIGEAWPEETAHPEQLSWRDARGALRTPAAEPAEVTIRRGRGAAS
jgi:hypothetical protein